VERLLRRSALAHRRPHRIRLLPHLRQVTPLHSPCSVLFVFDPLSSHARARTVPGSAAGGGGSAAACSAPSCPRWVSLNIRCPQLSPVSYHHTHQYSRMPATMWPCSTRCPLGPLLHILSTPSSSCEQNNHWSYELLSVKLSLWLWTLLCWNLLMGEASDWQGFPGSVTPDYVSFQMWDTLQVNPFVAKACLQPF
jgi:hypothetical protein